MDAARLTLVEIPQVQFLDLLFMSVVMQTPVLEMSTGEVLGLVVYVRRYADTCAVSCAYSCWEHCRRVVVTFRSGGWSRLTMLRVKMFVGCRVRSVWLVRYSWGEY